MIPQEQIERLLTRMRSLHATRPHHLAFFNRVQQELIPEVCPDADPRALCRAPIWETFLELFCDLVNREEEPGRMATVRWPRSLHKAMQQLAHREQTSLNKLIVRICSEAIFRYQAREQETEHDEPSAVDGQRDRRRDQGE